MSKYIGKRFLQLIPVLLGITFLSFAMMRAAGSDAIIELYGDKGAVAQEVIDAMQANGFTIVHTESRKDWHVIAARYE